MTVVHDPMATPLARPVDLSAAWNATDADVAARFEPMYGPALARLPDGPAVFRGLPFALGTRAAGRRWVLLDREITIDLRGVGRASHLVIAHFADSWRDATGRRRPGTPVGWVLPTGELLARYELLTVDGGVRAVDVRRRFEIADGIIGWGFLPFVAIGHRDDEAIDWRGPYPRQVPGRYAPAGHGGALTILPGSWGAAQTGVADYVPTPLDDATYWLHAIPLDREPAGLRLVPLGDGRPGTDIVIAALTVFDGTADPLVVAPRRQLSIEGGTGELPQVDLGIAIGSRPLRRPSVPAASAGPIGWGGPIADEPGGASPGLEGAEPARVVVDIAATPDARIRVDGHDVRITDLDAGADGPGGGIRIRATAARRCPGRRPAVRGR